jgi:hypothetical protein
VEALSRYSSTKKQESISEALKMFLALGMELQLKGAPFSLAAGQKANNDLLCISGHLYKWTNNFFS